MLHHAICLRPDRSLPAKLKPAKLIVVGSYRAGGAGKTPFCLWLAKELGRIRHAQAAGPQKTRHIAILCHSYAYDEVQMYREVLGTEDCIEIIETSDRHKTVLALLDRKSGDGNCSRQRPDYIICDDGFEDSRLAGAVNIHVISDETPGGLQDLWPAGPFRSLPKDHTNATATISLKRADIRFSIRKITNALDENLADAAPNYKQVNVFCGIGDPGRFILDLENYGITPSRKTFLKDHDRHFAKKIQRALKKFPQEAFIITHKDACRLAPQLRKNSRIFTAYQTVCVTPSAVSKVMEALKA